MSTFKVLLLVYSLAFVIRVLPLFHQGLSFHYDMARDAIVAQDMLNGDLKLVGPPSSSPNLFHGVLYYYLLTVCYFVSQGNPQGVAFIFSFISSLAAVPIYLLATSYFCSRRLGVVAALLYVFSFEATQYAPWLSNPSLALPTLGFYFLGLWYWSRGYPTGLWLSIVAASIASQLQLFLVVLFFSICLFWFVFRPPVAIKQLLVSVAIALPGFAVYLLSYMKTNSLQPLLEIFHSSNQFVFRIQFTDVFFIYFNRFADIYINNFMPINIFVGGLLALVCLYHSAHHRFVLFTLLTNLPLFFFGGHNSSYVNVGLVFPAILSILIAFKRQPWVLGIIFLANLAAYCTNFSRGQLSLVIPKDMTLKNELALVDQTYATAAGQPFSLNTTTLPLWTNTTWAYLYHWYGLKKYGYTPDFYGHDQVDLPGEKYLPHTTHPSPLSFLIQEPPDGIGPDLLASEQTSEDGHTKLLQEYHYGQLTLQSRSPWPK